MRSFFKILLKGTCLDGIVRRVARDLRAKQSSTEVSAEHIMYVSDQIVLEVKQ